MITKHRATYGKEWLPMHARFVRLGDFIKLQNPSRDRMYVGSTSFSRDTGNKRIKVWDYYKEKWYTVYLPPKDLVKCLTTRTRVANQLRDWERKQEKDEQDTF